MLQLADWCRLVDSRQLYLFLSSNTELNQRAFVRRLQQLHRADYLVRPKHQAGRRFLPGAANRPYAYAIGSNGHEALYPGRAMPNLKRKNDEIRAQAIDHRLGTTEAVLTFTVAARDQGCELRVHDAEDVRQHLPKLPRRLEVTDVYEAIRRDGSVELRTRTVPRVPIYPDALLTLTDVAGGVFSYFLEIDRGTEPIDDRSGGHYERASIRRKLLAYAALHTGGHHKRAGIERFNVLTITTTPARVESMRALARAIDPKQKGGSRLFLFTTADQVVLERPEDALTAPIWRTPREDDAPLSLLVQ